MSEGTDERMQKAAVEYRVGQSQNSQETVPASRVSPVMRPWACEIISRPHLLHVVTLTCLLLCEEYRGSWRVGSRCGAS